MTEAYSIDHLLAQMVTLSASDLHLTVGSPPVVRVRGHLQRFDGVPALTGDDTRDLLYRILNSEQQKQLELKRQLDFAHSIPGVARFRVNAYFQKEALFFFSSRRRHTISKRDWSSDVCSSDLRSGT